MKTYQVKSFAKINLALNVTGKMTRLHKIESIFCFISLHDIITIKQIVSPEHKISYSGKFSKNIKNNNTVKRLLNILDKEKLIGNKKFQIKIKKNIPQQAGLGGGSMNAASLLNFLIKKKYIKVNQKKITDISKSIGSDVILGVDLKNGILTSDNNIKKFSNCEKFFILLVKPNFGCSTKTIYSGVKNFTRSKYNKPRKMMFNHKYLSYQINALENIAFLKYPELKKIKLLMEKLRNSLFVRMTGSGSVMVAYFNSKKDCDIAKAYFKRKFKNYWCNTSKTL